MFYVITKRGVISGNSLNKVNQILNIKLEKEEMISTGNDYITNITDEDLDFLRDKKRLSTILFGNFFKKDKSEKMFIIINMILTFIILVSKH